jgi:hypothetical protein
VRHATGKKKTSFYQTERRHISDNAAFQNWTRAKADLVSLKFCCVPHVDDGSGAVLPVCCDVIHGLWVPSEEKRRRGEVRAR